MSTSLIAVDIGNTAIRVGWFDLSGPAVSTSLASPESVTTIHDPHRLDDLRDWLPAEPSVWRIASVQRTTERRLAEWIQQRRPRDPYACLNHSQLPLVVEVDQPDKVGMDRLLAAVGANRIRTPDRAAIVVDVGSAITVDLVSPEGAFLGGVILPGLQMSADALEQKTDLLPRVHFSRQDQPPPVVGKSTIAAMLSGLYWGTAGAIGALVEQISRTLDQPPDLLLTGGDALLLQDPLAMRIRASHPFDFRLEPHLVLCGIHICATSPAAIACWPTSS